MTTTHPMVATGSYYAFIAMTTNIHATLIQNIPVPQPKLRRAPLRITRLRIWEIYSRARSKVSWLVKDGISSFLVIVHPFFTSVSRLRQDENPWNRLLNFTGLPREVFILLVLRM